LGQRATSPGLRADEDGQSVERGIAGHTDRGFDLGKAAQCSLGSIGGQQGGMLFAVGDMCLVGRRAPHTHLAQAHHHLEYGHVPDDVDQLGRCAAAGQLDNRRPRHVDVHQHAGDVQ
jgi:hypothetical protein